MGCGPIVKKAAINLGISVANTKEWDYNPSSVGQTLVMNANCVSNFTRSRDKGINQSDSFYEENDD